MKVGRFTIVHISTLDTDPSTHTMEGSIFQGFIESFDEESDLRGWATEYGQLMEPVVQDHIAKLHIERLRR